MSTKNKKRGRPVVDSEMVRARVARPLLQALDEFCSDQNPPIARSDAVRKIVREYLAVEGYLPLEREAAEISLHGP